MKLHIAVDSFKEFRVGLRSFPRADLHLSLPPFELLEIGDYSFEGSDKIELGKQELRVLFNSLIYREWSEIN